VSASTSRQLVAIVGGSGAGKGWFVERLRELLPDKAAHLQLDNFYRDQSDLPLPVRARLNFDVPDAIDWCCAESVLTACRAGRTPRVPSYDFATYCRNRTVTRWAAAPIVFVDGLWLLRRPAVRQLFALTIFLDTPTHLRRSRRLARDVTERGYSVSEITRRFALEVAPMHDRYVEPQKKWADLVLQQPYQPEQVNQLAERLWSLVERSAPFPPWRHETFRADLAALLLENEYHR
jgi:uridine kinase